MAFFEVSFFWLASEGSLDISMVLRLYVACWILGNERCISLSCLGGEKETYSG